MSPTHKPLIVQGDGSLLLDTHDSGFEEARGRISRFAELEKSPEHIHTFRMSPLSLWNAASAGLGVDEIINDLNTFSRYPVPENIRRQASEVLYRYGKLVLRESSDPERLRLEVLEPALKLEIAHQKRLKSYLADEGEFFTLKYLDRGILKLEMIKLGYPVEDLVPLKDGEPLTVSLRDVQRDGRPFSIRDYQTDAMRAFVGNRGPGSGFGALVLPCGSGKTVVGMAVMSELKTGTLIITTNVAAVHQWRDELLAKTTLTVDEIGEYTGERKDIKSVTIATYQILVWRKDKQSEFTHFSIFRERNWGLVIYDEVHLLPAPVFRVTAEIQSIRRLGLTATLVREDGAEDHVFTLVGPKRYDVPWKLLEEKGWIARAWCNEIRISLSDKDKITYATTDKRKKIRVAAENPRKFELAMDLLEKHKGEQTLVIGQYLDQLEEVARITGAPLITGQTPNDKREEIYGAFKRGEVKTIVVSKVANFAIDLPDASVAIQISGSFGSRQEEAQRLGRILRPKDRDSHFYSLVSRMTVEEEFAANRQKFLTEQGYRYEIQVRE
jgi:DNA excision repair protein ERCC-3